MKRPPPPPWRDTGTDPEPIKLAHWLPVLGVVAVGLVIVYFVVVTIAGFRAETLCLRLGWPGERVTAGLRIYCVKRIDQTDSVVPLHVLQGKR